MHIKTVLFMDVGRRRRAVANKSAIVDCRVGVGVGHRHRISFANQNSMLHAKIHTEITATLLTIKCNEGVSPALDVVSHTQAAAIPLGVSTEHRRSI